MSAAELYPCDASVEPKFNDLKLRHKHKWVVFSIVNDKHTVKSFESNMAKTVHDLAASLSDSECCNIVFEYVYKTPDGRPTDKLFFISWLPRAASNPQKMMYTTARPSIRAACPGCFDLQASTKSDVLEGVLKTSMGKDEDEEDDAGGDWMDE
jgi:cofilin